MNVNFHFWYEQRKQNNYRKCVGKTSVIKQSNEALPHAITPVKNADTMKFCCLLITKYMPAEQTAADIVLNIKKNFLPSLSINKILIKFAGNAADRLIRDSSLWKINKIDYNLKIMKKEQSNWSTIFGVFLPKNTELDMVAEHWLACECDPEFTT